MGTFSVEIDKGHLVSGNCNGGCSVAKGHYNAIFMNERGSALAWPA